MSKTVLAEVDGFTPLIDVITADLGLVCSAVFGCMWRYCQMSDGVCRASQETIANKLGLSRKTVNEMIEKLTDAGYIEDRTPEVRNRPHIYADTGRASLRFEVTGGVTLGYTKPPEKPGGVTQGYSTVTESYTRCNPGLHLGVTESYKKKDSLRDSLRDDKEENPAQNPNFLWQMITQQLRDDIGMHEYASYVHPLKAGTYQDGVLTIRAVNSFTRDWCESRLGVKISRLATAIAGAETRVVFELESAHA